MNKSKDELRPCSDTDSVTWESDAELECRGNRQQVYAACSIELFVVIIVLHVGPFWGEISELRRPV
jgi:hypothetical protein